MDSKIPQVPQVPSPSFPSVDLHVYVKDSPDRCIIEKCPCQPHELSAVLALWQPSWNILINSHAE